MKVVTRGKFRQLVSSQGTPVLVKLYRCAVHTPPYAKNGKTYASFDISGASGQLEVLRQVDDMVHHHAKPAFSPVWGTRLVVKMNDTKFETPLGDPGPRFELAKGSLVDVELSPGAFGDFGYCWLLKRVKPSAATCKK